MQFYDLSKQTKATQYPNWVFHWRKQTLDLTYNHLMGTDNNSASPEGAQWIVEGARRAPLRVRFLLCFINFSLTIL
jgi:hypothetical protein